MGKEEEHSCGINSAAGGGHSTSSVRLESKDSRPSFSESTGHGQPNSVATGSTFDSKPRD